MLRAMLALVLVLAACGDGAADGAGGATPASDVATAPASETTAGSLPAETADPTTAPAEMASSDGCAHVIGGEIVWHGETATVSATVRSDDTGWDKYADAWEIRAPDDAVLGVRELAHPHETEQPFTRSLSGVAIPAGLTEVTLAAHDSVLGWCGETLTLPVPANE